VVLDNSDAGCPSGFDRLVQFVDGRFFETERFFGRLARFGH
jgi:hypothetical protein